MEEKIENAIFAAARKASVLGAVQKIKSKNPLVWRSLNAYVKWVGFDAVKRNGEPLLPAVLGEAIGSYRDCLPDMDAANAAYCKALLGSARDLSDLHYVGQGANGTVYEWDISNSDALAFMAAHPSVKVWRAQTRSFRGMGKLPESFMQAFVFIKAIPVALWPVIKETDWMAGDA